MNRPRSSISAVEYLRILYAIPITTNSSPMFQENNFITEKVLLRYGYEFAEKPLFMLRTGLYTASRYEVKLEYIAS